MVTRKRVEENRTEQSNTNLLLLLLGVIVELFA